MLGACQEAVPNTIRRCLPCPQWDEMARFLRSPHPGYPKAFFISTKHMEMQVGLFSGGWPPRRAPLPGTAHASAPSAPGSALACLARFTGAVSTGSPWFIG